MGISLGPDRIREGKAHWYVVSSSKQQQVLLVDGLSPATNAERANKDRGAGRNVRPVALP